MPIATRLPASPRAALVAALILSSAPAPAWAADDPPAAAPAGQDIPAPQDIVVTARRLDAARDSIQPSIGTNQVVLGRAALDVQPGGADRALSSVLLQAPGVTMDTADGDDIHIRNEHGNIQYRLNGVLVPETIRGFGPLVDTRVARTVEILTGALPAQYGERTAGVVQLTTQSGAFDADGDIGFRGGAYGTIQPSATFSDSFGRLNVFASGSYLRTDLGLAAPTPARTVLHDRTEQERGFGYLSYLIDDHQRLSLFGGTSIGKVQIPDTPGVAPLYALAGRNGFDSAMLDQNQKQQTHFGVLAWQYGNGGFDVQVAPYLLWARARYLPDPQGGQLMFDGIDSALTQTNLSYGVQADASLKLGADHTLRFGIFAQREHDTTASVNRVFAVDGAGNQTSDVPITVPVDRRAGATTLAGYVQDEWRIAHGLTLNAGLRYDRYTAALTEDQLSPRASLVWKPLRAVTIHAGYARNFTPPPLALIGVGNLAAFTGTTGAAAVTTGDPVRAEREHEFDIGAQWVIGGHLTLGIDSYLKLKRNLLDDTQYGASQLLAPFNYATGRNWGVEGSVAYARGPITAYANLARGEEKGRRIVSGQFFFAPDELAYIAGHDIFTDHSQTWTGSAGASARIRDPWGELQPSVEVVTGSGLRRTLAAPDAVPNGATQQAYAQVDIGLGQKIGRSKEHGLTVRIDVVNLFDSIVLVHDGSGVGAGQNQYLPRRAVYFSIHQTF